MAAPEDFIQSSSGFFGASSGGLATRSENSKRFGGVHPRSQYVVSVAGPRHGAAADRTAMLLERHDVGQHLAGMRTPRQAVDDRHRRIARQFPDRRRISVRIMMTSI